MTAGRGSGRGLAVLTYHGFGTDTSPTTTDPAWFAETLSALRAAGYHGVDLADWVARGRPDEPRGFALAFDDGLASVADVASVVAAHGVPATVFVVTDRVGRDNAWPGQPAWVTRERILGWSELRDLLTMGFRVGAHGRTHARLDALDVAALDDELRGSRDAVEQALGVECPLAAYPYGLESARVRRAARRHFAAAFGTRLGYATGSEDAHALSRIDAYYLRDRGVLEFLVRDRWRGGLRVRRVLRTVRQWVSPGPGRPEPSGEAA